MLEYIFIHIDTRINTLLPSVTSYYCIDIVIDTYCNYKKTPKYC